MLDYPLWWVVCSYDLYMYTGDTEYITDYYPVIVKVLDKFYPSITNSTTQLLQKGLGVSGGYGDYAFLPRSGPVTYYNVLYVLALNHAASIATFLGGHDDDASRWTTRAAHVSGAVNGNLFDTSVGAFWDGTCGSSPCATHAQDGNSISIRSGVANQTTANSVLSYLSKAMARPYGNSFYDNDVLQESFSQRVYAFISYFEIDARFKTGLADSALDQIRRMYGWMAANDPGVTAWEGIGPNGTKYEGAFTSLAHGWSTGIVPALTNNVLGVTPTGPGFSTYIIKPTPGDVQWAKGVVPTPKGPIKVYWDNSFKNQGVFFLTASAPDGYNGTFSVPVTNSSVPVYLNSQLVSGGENGTDINVVLEDGYASLPVSGLGENTITVGYKVRGKRDL